MLTSNVVDTPSVPPTSTALNGISCTSHSTLTPKMSDFVAAAADAFVAAARAVADDSGTVILTMTNFGFIDLAENLIASIARHAPASLAHLLMLALDDESKKHFDDDGRIATVLVPRRRGAATYDGNAASFGSVGFVGICHEKAWLVAHLMRFGLHVLWTDSDIVWLDDARLLVARQSTALAAMPRIESVAPLLPVAHARARIVRDADAVDFVFQADDDGLCAGFFLARASPRALRFMDSVLCYLNPVVCDQMSMRRFVDDTFDGSQLNVVVLDRTAFPNGTAFFDLKLPQRQSIQPCIIHNNCIIGHDSKVRRFVDFRLWFRDNRPTPTPTLLAAISSTSRAGWHCSATLRGHREVVGALLVMPDGALLSGSHDKSLRTWRNDVCSHIEVMHMRGGVWSLGRLDETVFTGSHDRTAIAWQRGVGGESTGAWQQTVSFAGHTRPVNALCIGNDGTLVTASDDATLRSWTASTGAKLKVFVGHTDCVTALAVSGGAVFSASMDSTARAWQLSTARCMQMYVGHTAWVRCIVAPAGSTMIYTGSADRTMRAWDQRSGDCLSVVPFDDGIAALLADGDRLLVACDRGAIVSLALPKLDNCVLIRASPNETDAPFLTSIAVLEQNKAIAVGFANGSIEIWRH
jgi:hypothetical protein